MTDIELLASLLVYFEQLNGQAELLQLRGEVVHPNKLIPLLLDLDGGAANLLDT